MPNEHITTGGQGFDDIGHQFDQMAVAIEKNVGAFELLATAVEVVAAQLLTIPTLIKDALKNLGQGQGGGIARAQEVLLTNQLGEQFRGLLGSLLEFRDQIEVLEDK